MHYLGERYHHNTHITLRKRFMIIFLFCSALFITFFLRTVHVEQHDLEINNFKILYDRCQENLKALQMTLDMPLQNNYDLEKHENIHRKPVPFTAQLQLNKMNGSKAATGFQNLKPLQASNFILPHLKEGSEGLVPGYYLDSRRNAVDIVIGVPTVRRERATYLNRTLKDLMDGIVDDTTTILIIVMIAETELKYVLETAWEIEKEFPREVHSGLIEIISPSSSYYPNLYTIPPTLGDSQLRTRWRAKQVLDRVFLLAHGLYKGSYYLMMEDDVVAKKMFIRGVKSYISYCTENKPEWLILEFSHYTGSLGKLFRASDVGHFILFLQLFYYNKPLDFLIESYLGDKACGKIKTSEQCNKDVDKIRIKHPVSLFLHVGLYSSLTGKYMKVESATAVVGHTFFPHKNPPLKYVYCNIRELPFHTAKMAYNGEYIFMGVYPEPGNVIEFWFQKPTVLKRYLIQTGNYQNTKDILKKADVEVLLADGLNENFTKVGSFDEFGFSKENLDMFGPLKALRLKVVEYGARESGKVVISEIELVPMDVKELN